MIVRPVTAIQQIVIVPQDIAKSTPGEPHGCFSVNCTRIAEADDGTDFMRDSGAVIVDDAQLCARAKALAEDAAAWVAAKAKQSVRMYPGRTTALIVPPAPAVTTDPIV